MNNIPSVLKESERWHARADKILHDTQLVTRLGKFGDVVTTGSYAYGVMFSGDIDFHLICRPSKELAQRIVNSFIDDGQWRGVKYVDNYQYDGSSWSNWPKSYYVGLTHYYENYKWGIDIWMMDSEMNQQRIHPWVLDMMTPEKRRIILEIKAGRDKEFKPGGFEIYDAVLRNGVTNVASFKAWRKNVRA